MRKYKVCPKCGDELKLIEVILPDGSILEYIYLHPYMYELSSEQHDGNMCDYIERYDPYFKDVSL